jgi:hypothetical protein
MLKKQLQAFMILYSCGQNQKVGILRVYQCLHRQNLIHLLQKKCIEFLLQGVRMFRKVIGYLRMKDVLRVSLSTILKQILLQLCSELMTKCLQPPLLVIILADMLC